MTRLRSVGSGVTTSCRVHNPGTWHWAQACTLIWHIDMTKAAEMHSQCHVSELKVSFAIVLPSQLISAGCRSMSKPTLTRFVQLLSQADHQQAENVKGVGFSQLSIAQNRTSAGIVKVRPGYAQTILCSIHPQACYPACPVSKEDVLTFNSSPPFQA